MIILHPGIWPYFSWVMSGVDYFDGVAKGIAPFVRGGCEDLANARGGASMVMLAFGTAVTASALASCTRAGSADSKPVDKSDDGNDQQFDAYIGSFSFMVRIIGLALGLMLSAGAFLYFWLEGGEWRTDLTVGCSVNTTLGQAAYICFFGFIALAAPLAVLKNIYRVVYGMGRYRRT